MPVAAREVVVATAQFTLNSNINQTRDDGDDVFLLLLVVVVFCLGFSVRASMPGGYTCVLNIHEKPSLSSMNLVVVGSSQRAAEYKYSF